MTQPSWPTSPYLSAYDTIAAALRRAGLDPEKNLARMIGGLTVNPGYAVTVTVLNDDVTKLAALLPGAPPADGKVSTVADLIAILSTMDQTLPVMSAWDAEGNGFATVSEVVETLCDGETTWHTPEQWAAELANPSGRYDPEDDAPPPENSETGDGVARRVVLLWP